MMKNKESSFLIRPYKVSDYDDVSRIFTAGILEAVHPLRNQLLFSGNHIQRPMQLVCFCLGSFATGHLGGGLLGVTAYCILAIMSQHLCQYEYLR